MIIVKYIIIAINPNILLYKGGSGFFKINNNNLLSINSKMKIEVIMHSNSLITEKHNSLFAPWLIQFLFVKQCFSTLNADKKNPIHFCALQNEH